MDKYGWALNLGTRRVHVFVCATQQKVSSCMPQITEGPCRSRVDNFGNWRDLRMPFIPVKFIYTLYVLIHSEGSMGRQSNVISDNIMSKVDLTFKNQIPDNKFTHLYTKI